MRARVREVSEAIRRDGLTVSIPKYFAPGDAIALGELLEAERIAAFEFRVCDVSDFVKGLIRERFPNASIIEEVR